MSVRHSYLRRWSAIASIAVLSAMFTSCAANPSGDSTPTPTPAATSSTQIADQLWEQVAAKYPDAERPTVAVVRYVDRFEWAGTVAA